MTTLNQAAESIYNRFATQWGTTSAYTFDSESYNSDTTWVRVTVRNTESEQETLGPVGNRNFLRRGTVFIQVFAPINEGRKAADTLTTTARDIFEGVSFDGLRFFAGLIRELGSDGSWYQETVELDFDYDETK